MGKRSINTTKGGKFMNPTDRARKEARKKELKKNKSKRQMVRTAVLKGTDAKQLLCELEKIDKMEFDVTQPPQLNENVLKEKRRKLQENFRRVMRFCEKDDPPQWTELKRTEGEYNRRRIELMQYFQSVKNAEQVQIDDIPMPELPFPDCSRIPMPQSSATPTPTPTPQFIITQPLLILKKPLLYRNHAPGVPPGPPPVLSDSDDDEIEESKRKISFPEETEAKLDFNRPWGHGTANINNGAPPGPPPGLPPHISGPPPGLLPQCISAPPMRLPPAAPPSLMFLPELRANSMPTVVSAPPSLIKFPKAEKKMAVTIKAKPQIKNLIADATRFMPTALMVKREEKKGKREPMRSVSATGVKRDPLSMIVGPKKPLPTKDDAYAQFMKEMTGFL